MLRPEVVKQLECPLVGLATSWSIGRKSIPAEDLPTVIRSFQRKYWPFPKEKIAKSNLKAKRLREEGNAAYKKSPQQPEKAMELYNQSICWSEEGSEELGLSYANRSAVYFSQKLYHDCLENIELARHHNYPEEMSQKLTDREDRCRKLMEGSFTPRKSSVGHSFVESSLQLNQDARSIRTNRNLNVGDKVLIEKPFILVLEAVMAYQRCDFCGSRNELNLLPCKGCTAVMYCSSECQEQALQRYHRFECEIVDDIQLLFRGPKITRIFHVMLRLFWFAVQLYLEDPAGFPKRITDFTEQIKHEEPFGMDPFGNVLHLLATCPDKIISPDDKPGMTGICVSQYVSVLIYVIAVEENESLKQCLKGTTTSETLLPILFQLIENAICLVDKQSEEFSCYYPFARLLKHSCTPNGERLLLGTQSVVILKRPVTEGQNITVAFAHKLASIKTNKNEQCECDGCKTHYPKLTKLEVGEKLALELAPIRSETDTTIQRKELRDFLLRHDELYPKPELDEAWNLFRSFILKDIKVSFES
ncbi:uncharacterized protein LOC128729583 [Anopheles nili]|uniref:uncharacterized protein LOC128729583 n=1 Tax=Anopheles nili TaxID=185578 RepID=UPI00237C2C8E|nr:uncharacterized protein LOC128729583 [Anopheles nili]